MARPPDHRRPALLKALAAGTAGLLVLLGLAIWFGPGMLDWSRYRSQLAAFASLALGQPVRIDGPISLELVPQPMLTASDVAMLGPDGSTIGMARHLRLGLAIGPLLAGQVDARELVLQGVDAKLPWPMPPQFLSRPHAILHAALAARIEDGRLTLGTAVFSRIDAGWITSDSGTSVFTGTAQLAGQLWRFTARISAPGGDGSTAIDAAIDGQDNAQGTQLQVTGQLLADGTFPGRILAHGPDLSRFLPSPAVAFRADGRLNIAGGVAVADELTLDLGGVPARGALALRITPTPRLDAAITASRLDLDAWLPALLAARSSDALGTLPMSIDLSAEAAAFRGGTLRGLRGAFDLEGDHVEMRELRATLPGEAVLRLSGRIVRSDPAAAAPHFDGTATLAAPALRTTLDWLASAAPSPLARLPPGVLRSGRLAGHVVMEPGQLVLDRLTGTLDAGALTGSMTLRRWPGTAASPASIGAGLAIDRLVLDPWLAGAPNSLPGIAERLAGMDLDLRLDAKQASLAGIDIAPLSLDAGIEAGRLSLRKLDLTANAVHLVASGGLAEGGRINEGRLTVQSPAAANMAALLPGWIADRMGSGFWRAPLNGQFMAAGPPQMLALTGGADIGDLRADIRTSVNEPAAAWSGAVTLRHPGAPRLAEAFGLLGAPAWLGDGSFSLVAQMAASPGRIAADSFELAAGALHATGSLAVQTTPTGRAITGQISAETLPAPLPYLRSPTPLDLAGLSGWQASVRLDAGRLAVGAAPVLEKFSASVVLADGLISLQGITAQLSGGSVAGDASFDSRAEPPVLAIHGALGNVLLTGPVLELPIDITGGRLGVQASLTASGHSPAALLATLGGTLHASVADGMLAGIELAGLATPADAELPEPVVRAAFAGGSTAFALLTVDARLEGGSVRLDQGTITAPSATIAITGSLDLPAQLLDLRLRVRPAIPDPPELGLRLTGPFQAPVRTPELADLVRWRAERAVR